MTGSLITSSAGSDSGSVAPAFALAKSAAISSALSWRFGSLFVVSATASSAIKLEEYMITEDTTFYAVFDNNPINVYEDIHPEYFAVSK